MTRRELMAASVASAGLAAQVTAQTNKIEKIVRFERGGKVSYGLLNGDQVTPIVGTDIFKPVLATAKTSVPLSSVKLLYPIAPPKIVAVGRNYKSHAGENAPPKPEMFFKPNTCLQHPGDPIIVPSDSKNLHYEGELVLVMGKKLRNASKAEAAAAIFGVTCGNDVSERDWQGGKDKDMQWWRAKGADTFGPLGPWIVKGLDPGNLMLTTRLNGKVVQQQSTKDLLFDCATCISFISKYVTLEQGDVIYTGTPGTTAKMAPGDVCEVEIEGIGVLRNPLKAA
ncbi:MAG: fumarylacetoacetate hydrolase family protein [Acidobacteria bacterium]|nr:fumarylacetoacetate hydrolase family protein [Acidobacteriota bacterium]